MLKVFCAPARYTQGPNATASLGEEIVNLGLSGPALIVAGRSAAKLLEPVWQEALTSSGIDFRIFHFTGECTSAEIARGVEAGRAMGARLIIGAGGGKVLDTSRAIASDLGLPQVNCPPSPPVTPRAAPCRWCIQTKALSSNTGSTAVIPTLSWWTPR